jgi:SNF family Na+-dependent transporter
MAADGESESTAVVAHTTEYDGGSSIQADEPGAAAGASARSEGGVDSSSSTKELLTRKDERQEFSNYFEFLITSLGYCVGLGNLIVYPGRVFEHGGGAFLVAYAIFLVVLGIPMYTHDLKVGQYMRKGAFAAFVEMKKRLWGVGLAHILIAFIMISYFNVIIGWGLLYLIHSFRSPLPWKGNTTAFFYETILNKSSSIAEADTMNWEVFGANLFAWVLTALVLIKGVSSGGKVAIFTVTAPYVCIIALIVRGTMLPGYMDGIRAYLTVDPSKLLEFETWARAASQIFYSLGLGMGAIITFGSYQQRSNTNYTRDGTIIPLMNCLTSFIGGFAIFSMLGFLSKETGEDIGSMDLTGFSIAFIGFTEGLASFPNGAAQAFSVIFFLMIVTLGIDTQIGVTEAVITFAKETSLSNYMSSPMITVLTCLVGFLVSLPCTTDAGFYWVNLLWDYGNYMSMFIVTAFSLVGSSWIAGTQWHHRASETLRGKRENPLFLFMWRFLNPIACIALFGIALAGLIPYPTTLAGGVFPLWGQILSGILNFGPSLIVLVGLAIPPVWLWGRSGGKGEASSQIQLSRSKSEQYAKMVDTVLNDDPC